MPMSDEEAMRAAREIGERARHREAERGRATKTKTGNQPCQTNPDPTPLNVIRPVSAAPAAPATPGAQPTTTKGWYARQTNNVQAAVILGPIVPCVIIIAAFATTFDKQKDLWPRIAEAIVGMVLLSAMSAILALVITLTVRLGLSIGRTNRG